MGEEEVFPPEEIAWNVDRYLSMIQARSKWLARVVLIAIEYYPLLSLKRPFSRMGSRERRDFITERFYQDVRLRLLPPIWTRVVQGMIRMAKQLCYLGYYNDPRTFESVGYVPFSRRPDREARGAPKPDDEHLPLKVTRAAEFDGDQLLGDVVIVGSGAAGAILAHGLAARGREVLMIERGDYVKQSEFTENEVEMISKLYSDGAFQLTRDFRFQILQGSCVGGTTVVNNAICFDLPEDVLAQWNEPTGLHANLDGERLRSAFQRVRRLVGVELQNHDNLNRGAKYFSQGVRELELDRAPNEFGPFEANIHDCLGCGYCNIGCAYGKKLSMLDTVLPMTQRDFGTKSLRIVAGCEAEKIHVRGNRAVSVTCRTEDGRTLEVKGNTFVLSAGAVSSSILLLRSRVGGRNVGKRLAFNMGSPISAVFDDVVDSYDGLQMSHYLKLSPSKGYVLETIYNPPVAQALIMPGWFHNHFINMLRYNRMTSAGVIVGTQSDAEVRKGSITGREVRYHPSTIDLDVLLEGLVLTGEIYFAAGAKAVLPSTFAYHEFRDVESLRRLPQLVKDSGDITLGSSHPQGGNALSRNEARGVVDPEFRVYDHENLFVCDASVFPSSIGVNPQLTVMALADYAVPFVSETS